MLTTMYLRILVIVSLFGIFINFFGLESFSKFKSGGVMIDRKHVYYKNVVAPAIVVCPRNLISKNGWKGNQSSMIKSHILEQSPIQSSVEQSPIPDGVCEDEKNGEDKEMLTFLNIIIYYNYVG